MMKGKTLGSGDKCPYCNEGRLLLCDTFTSQWVEVDSEPYKSGEEVEGLSGEEICLNGSVHISITACDDCKRIIGADIQDSFYNDEQRQKRTQKVINDEKQNNC